MSYNTEALERGRAFFNRMKHQMTIQTDTTDKEESTQLQDSLVKYYMTRNKTIPEWLETEETRQSLERLKIKDASTAASTNLVTPTAPIQIKTPASNVPELTHRGRSPSPTSPQTPTSPAFTNQRPPLKSRPSQLQDIYARRGSSADVSRQNSVTGFEKYGRPNGYQEVRNARVPPPLNQESTDRMREKLRNLSRSNSVQCH
ncbi:hypothetical protein B0I72DRAFT_134456 [Yarrowia lipolytica]|uniref:YALI0E09581p n=2 Tax=Yarrowia lipolytica TaxID=4952 RepID=Q6C6H2_YARLI|nr:YALI0E09581p [Yarrowia lipolytica CLIB122]RDW26962.1 hypothetical protein B0I71DRAFT_129969 [Yarrowia lipolytica]RDW34616.1 hypothetical protein B0I72DRAFT_134456 [Yarrowia lipolytica]RDW40178.1 hypothetical protein B0I73DRAFT_130826 [Yarrowia lipolytica]RDW43744.1 hypothetical protein B0I74DRAFT_141540 [Yarrowia lipolytica]RDW50468.1 hypothetical protein B0I75DRAFT_141434 [Yarrowia lipolytica]|eukprot:XP_503740.1 YALI0E09581p [Yarrowia lipolytica CLIB122]